MAAKIDDLPVGRVFGRLTLLGTSERRSRYVYEKVRCECGVEKFIERSNLLRGAAKSCGCLNSELASVRSKTHGMSASPIYAVWNAIKQRTTNSNSLQWADYGGRGVTLDPLWFTFEGFYSDMGDTPFVGATVERVDNNLGYCKSNCVWATRDQQANNKRNNRKFDFRGKSYSLKELSELSGVKVATLSSRLYLYNWPVEVAVETPVAAKPKPNNAPH